MTTTDRITKLADAYQRMICLDHHKDLDCHWYIQENWSYGEHAGWSVVHYGYCYDQINKRFDTYDEALIGLEQALRGAIVDQVEWAERALTEPDEWSHSEFDNAKRILELANACK